MTRSINILVIGLIAFAGLFCVNLEGWEDHPDIQDHSETDRIYKLAQIQTGAAAYEAKMIDEQIEKDLEKFIAKTCKWKNKDGKEKTATEVR